MIESGVGSPSLDQIVALAALALMLGTARSLDKISSPRVEINPPVAPKEQAELLDKFLKLNPEAQRGAIRYIEEMREGYKKKTRI
ncbi:hypothetical protein ES705_26843 [subsurface metagenome]